MLGGGESQISAIKKEREMGCYIILFDMYKDILGK